MTIFLVIVGLTGSFLVFYPELERLLNPQWYPDRATGAWLSAGEIASQLEAVEPRLHVNQVSLQGFDGATSAWVQGNSNPNTCKPYDLGYNYVILDPSNGKVLDRVEYGAITSGLQNLMGFIYDLHWTLALGSFGMWLLGILALAWTFDCFIGFYLTLPVSRRIKADGLISSNKTWWQRWNSA
jgi:uncharacterized iron-regulated membrane protein